MFLQGNVMVFFVGNNRFSRLTLTYALTFVSLKQHEDHFFWREVGQWFDNSDLGRKGVRKSQKFNLA